MAKQILSYRLPNLIIITALGSSSYYYHPYFIGEDPKGRGTAQDHMASTGRSLGPSFIHQSDG